jgi:hypothetical protein
MIRADRILIVLRTDAVRAMGPPRPREGGAMRGFYCVDPSHGRIDFAGADDEELFEHIKAHTAEAHPDLTDRQVREMIGGADWWRSMATSGQNSGSSPSAYDK